MVATGVNVDGYREVLGVATSTAKSGAGSNTFFKDLVARGSSAVAPVTFDAHDGLVEAIGSSQPFRIISVTQALRTEPEWGLGLELLKWHRIRLRCPITA